MIGKGIRKKLNYENGRYFVDIDITKDEWKEMLTDDSVFDKDSKDMVLRWYFEEDHRATSKTIMDKYNPDYKASPYNAIVKSLTQRILKYLNYRFWVESYSSPEKESFYSIPFEGWHVDYNPTKRFVWKLRDELIEAIEEVIDESDVFDEEIFSNNLNTSVEDELLSFVPVKEGKPKLYHTTIYERNIKNRNAAIKIAKREKGGLFCKACGFDFEKFYGERGKDFIEIHHSKPLSEAGGEITVDPHNDLHCLCSNCHRMIHRNKSETLSVDELIKIIDENSKD